MLELIKVKYDQDIKNQLEKRFIAFSSLGWFSNISLVICVKLEINSETSTSALTSVLNF